MSSPYLFLELGVLLFAYLISVNVLSSDRIAGRNFVACVIGLFFLWFAIDQVALCLELWAFPLGNSVAPHIFGLPVEEYLIFTIHTFVCLFFLEVLRR